MLGKQAQNQNDSSMVGQAEETQKRVSTPQRAPDGYLIEVGQYTQMALDHFNKYAH
jgi:hypothetical protein